MKKIKVMIVDDSAVVRKVLTEKMERSLEIEVIGSASDPIFAMDKMMKAWPDVVVLDVEMPRMDGITFLKKIMSQRPTPVIICSTLTEKGAETTIQALSAGAVSIVTKPKAGLKDFLEDEANDIINVVKVAARANLKRIVHADPLTKVAPKLTADAVLSPPSVRAMAQTTERIVAIGTSTGGTQALEAVLAALPRVSPGIVIVQHMPENFTAAFAKRLNDLCEIEVKEAVQGDRVIAGRALIAPGGKHMLLKRSGAQYHVDVIDGPLVSRHRPSVNVLFRSVAQQAGKNALGIIMTGMGDDGAQGLKEMRDVGAATLGQDEHSCVVYGMPKEANKLGAVQRELPLSKIPQEIVNYGSGNRT
ncbi:protein-glutamate methylesterase/protein-glutamine glutaminase [Methylophilus aquaticus]|uniref:Protein-glutamate methylesterase/protein-glutamine glutaminase n=1 Tax=Methylophilus aquaticus TaxID=1971610 RepID=A0ABT9JS08_9PROT|nr:chemotaxis response regulator protein-glutamate methylesterase [Methylophilus aquaticus]MDP8567335.1 chemotaxis response regulator protein-glutamate methylesterase [Methylophilus aquaticus]